MLRKSKYPFFPSTHRLNPCNLGTDPVERRIRALMDPATEGFIAPRGSLGRLDGDSSSDARASIRDVLFALCRAHSFATAPDLLLSVGKPSDDSI